MRVVNRLAGTLAPAAFVVALGAITLWGQLPIPVPGQNNAPQRGGQVPEGQRGPGQQGQRGRGAPAAPPAPMVVAPLATASPEITGPGRFFETLMQL